MSCRNNFASLVWVLLVSELAIVEDEVVEDDVEEALFDWS